MSLWLRSILAFHVAFHLIVIGSCQFEDEALSPDETLLANYEDNNGPEDDDTPVPDYIDNRIDSKQTFVTGVEKFIKAISRPLGWISNGGSSSDKNSAAPHNNVGKFIDGITKPIRNIVTAPAGRAVQHGFGEVLNMIGDRFKAIFPGTEWCGAGNIAKNPEEVGIFKKTDSCCRTHDQCSMNLNAGQAENGLINNGIFTRSHCLCDAHFYYCLKEARSLIATNIGLTYFNILRPQCFKEEYPARCVRYGRTRLSKNKCLDYDYDYTKNKTWQWFDSPDFL